MAKPTEKKIRNTILQTVRDMFKTDREALTVRVVRNNAEATLDLEQDFLKQGAWKEKSSELIRNEVGRLDEEDAPSPVKDVVGKKETKKRPAPVKKAAPAKRKKKNPTPEVESELESAAYSSSPDEAEISDVPTTKKRASAKRATPAKSTARRENKAASPSDEEDLSEVAEDSESAASEASFHDSESDAAAKNGVKKGKKADSGVESGVESELSDTREDENSDASATLRPKAKPAAAVKSKMPPPKSTSDSKAKLEEKVKSESEAEVAPPKKEEVDTDEESNKDDSEIKYNAFKTPPSDTAKPTDEVDPDASESEMSVVLDEPPKPTRRSKAITKSVRTKKARAPAKLKVTTTTPEQEELKTLQSQLGKCGIRKVWGAYLKSFDTHKAKVHELKRTLREAGMDGRFSESKAAEIKERRELEADIGFLEDTAKIWGVVEKTRGRRGAVQQRKNLKVESGSGSDEEEEEYVEDIEEREAERRKEKAKADLAFLGDEESESD